jgi:DNA-binding GntR family transcriptional regulator
MAAAAGVSLVPMWKAVDALKREGILSAVRGGRITRTGVPAGFPPPRPRGKWREAMEALRKDIASGRLPAGAPLPDADHLRDRHGISRPTLRKALAALHAAGDLEAAGRIWRVPVMRFRGRARYASVTLVAAAGATGD